MSILRGINCNNPIVINKSFEPFINPDYIEGMIIGNDLDSLISSCILKNLFGWDVVGVYDYKSLWYSYSSKQFRNNIFDGKYIAVDLDIYNENIPSIGHHILSINSNDILIGHENSLNPNLIRDISHKCFSRKYPLSTSHFLFWIFKSEIFLNDMAKDLIWLADSSYINGQSHRFRKNVFEWIKNFFNNDSIFLETFNELNDINFEKRLHDNILPLIKASGLNTSKGYVKSFNMKLKGNQCQWNDSNNERNNIISMYETIKKITSWDIPSFPFKFNKFQGNRKNYSSDKFINGNLKLDNFLAENNVFSYVFPSYSTINYTSNIFNK